MQKDILGNALLDYHKGRYTEDIRTYASLDETDVMPLPYLFRNYTEMPPLEKKALQLCKGQVLDVGCGAGSHALYLQEKGFDITALDRSPGAIEVCSQRGIRTSICTSLLEFDQRLFDTLLLLMNGIGIVGTLGQLDLYFKKLKSLLKPNGQVLLDSSDIMYMYEPDGDGGHWIPDNITYYGEVQFSMEYKKKRSAIFPWLYLDFNTLRRAAECHGFRCELVREGKHYDYLARLSLKK